MRRFNTTRVRSETPEQTVERITRARAASHAQRCLGRLVRRRVFTTAAWMAP